MDVLKTLVHFEGSDDERSYLVDTIHHDGAWWLVASWKVKQTIKSRAPERLVRLTGLHYEEVQGKPYRFVLNKPLPKDVFDGQERDGYVVATNRAIADGTPPNTEKLH
jgi:hypothetical protein